MKNQKNSGFVFYFNLVVCSLVLGTMLGCTPGKSSKSSSAQNGQRVVNLATWSAYVSPEKIQEFEKRSGIKVQISNYSSNEELLAKLQAGASGYDVAVPSDYMVYAMIKLGLLQEIRHEDFPVFKTLNPKFLNKPFDPENKYSLPYDWGTTAIGVNQSLLRGQPIKGWKDIFERPELAGKFSLLDDSREVIGAALKSLGYSLNSKNPEELEKAKQVLLKARSRVKSFTSEPLMPLSNGETTIAHAFSCDVLQARRNTKGKVTLVFPEEGGTLWLDNLVIPKGAKNIKEAQELIQFLFEGHANAVTITKILAAPTNQEVIGLLPKELQTDPSLFPSDATLQKFEMLQDLGDFLQVWDRIWTEIKASSK